jgi:hypothetical protein
MFVFFDPETRAVRHIVTLHPANYGEWLAANPPEGQRWAETSEDIPFEDIEILEDFTVQRRATLEGGER